MHPLPPRVAAPAAERATAAPCPPHHRRAGGWLLVSLLCAGLVAPAAIAATRTVTNLKDSGPGSLSHTISGAAIGDTIVFKSSLFNGPAPAVIVLNNTITIDKSLTIIGPGDYVTTPAAGDVQGSRRPRLVLRGTKSSRVVRVLSSGQGNTATRPAVTISGIAFTAGDSSSSHFGGGGILIDGGASLTLERCDVFGNRGYFGGGIACGWREGVGGSQLTLIECLVAGNEVSTNGSVSNSSRGGGIGSIDSIVTIRRSLIINNRTDLLGGGFGGSHGGGLYAIGGSIVIDNSTLAGNRALFGGGAAFGSEGTALSALISSCTIVDNFADNSQGGGAAGGGLCVRGGSADVGLTGSIVTRNGVVPLGGGAPVASDFAVLADDTFGIGTFSSEDYNLMAASGDVVPAPHDLVGIDPFLDPRADNGGRTFTYALQGNSPAINTGDPTIAGASGAFDQRGAGFPRVAGAQAAGARIDIGAFEYADRVPPTIQLVGPASITLPLGQPYIEPGYLASDNNGTPTVTRTVNGVIDGIVDTCRVETYTIVYTATDIFGNTASVTRTVNITAPTITIDVDDVVSFLVDPGFCAARRHLADFVTITGLPAACSLSIDVTVQPPNAVTPTSVDWEDLIAFPLGTTAVNILITAPGSGNAVVELANASFSVEASDPFSTCLSNIAWPLAESLSLFNVGGGTSQKVALFRQMVLYPGESRWFRFVAAPGGQIDITLTNLPGNFDLIVYTDIKAAYDELTALVAGDAEEQALGLLGTDFAGERRSPEAYSPDAFARPEAYSPDALAATRVYSPEAYSPDGYARPEAYSPDVFAAPEAYSPEDLAARNIQSPEAYSPDAYSAAQQRSLVAFSAAPGTISEGIRFNTYNAGGVFYVRVRGQQGVYSTDAPFDLTVTVTEGLCANVVDLDTTPTLAPTIPAATKSLFIWDSTRLAGTPTEVAALGTSLGTFANAVNGAVIDVAGDARIAALNAQADANPYCPLAKNLIAEAIRNLIASLRATHPTIADITMIGNDDAIPFFRTDDEANLGNEVLYFPPVLNASQSQSSLRYNQVLTQDRYGSSNQLVLVTGPYDLPEIPVARLVETAVEVKSYLDAYLPLFAGVTSTGGVLPTPQTGLVAAYDFMADSGAAIQAEFAAGLGRPVDALISPIDVPPSEGWTANELRAQFLGARHDITHLAAHFSTSAALAADYITRLRAAEIAASPVDLKFALITSNGCHSGYNTVDEDAIPLVTDQPDWAQAFARKHALWVSGTGYQYGDTDFIDYTERLLLEYVQTLRTGTGPVALGQALVDAKRRYLSETPLMRGIHEKSLLQLTLYGLPMVKINLPGRLPPTVPPGGAVAPTGVASGPGVANALRTGDLVFAPSLTRVDQTLNVLDSAATVTASYFTGPHGFVPVPGEPVRPLQSFNVHSPLDGFVRGVGFRGGNYTDETGFRPFTGAPGTELSTVHGKFDSPTFFPVQPWALNQLGFLTLPEGYTALHTFPTQFVSDVANPESDLGTLRKYGQMHFTLFYCPATSTAALANAPALNFVASVIEADGVHVSVDAAATTAAGVQEVWVCFTGVAGSNYHGAWQSFTLTGPGNATGNGAWTGLLPLAPGTDLSLIRFFVQAVNGFGAVSANTNVGRYFGIGESTLDGIGTASAPTSIAFLGSPPSSGKYGDLLPLQARLADGANAPMAGKTITFQVGSAARSALTNSLGIATTTLRLNTPPAADELQATFAGDTVYRNAIAAQPFTVGKQISLLNLAPDGTGPDASHIFATLTAPGGTKLKERAVIFLANDGTNTTAIVEITNGGGVARLAPDALALGTYQVAVYFGQTVTLANGIEVALTDPLYQPSQDLGTFTIAIPTLLPLNISRENVSVSYGDTTAPGATSKNRGHSRTDIDGRIGFEDPSLHFDAITSAGDTSLSAHVRFKLSNQQLFDGDVLLYATSNPEPQWEGSATVNGAVVRIFINWLPSWPSGHVSLSLETPPKSGPLYKDTPAILECELTLGTGPDEHPARLDLTVGDTLRPWTKQATNSRTRNVP